MLEVLATIALNPTQMAKFIFLIDEIFTEATSGEALRGNAVTNVLKAWQLEYQNSNVYCS
jgi:hypothetical protein